MQPAIVSYEKVPQTQILKLRGMVKKLICKIPSRGKFGKCIQGTIFFNSSSLWICLMHLLNQAISMGKQMLT